VVQQHYAAKCQILKTVFLNVKLDCVSLSYKMTKLFDALAKGLVVSSNRSGGTPPIRSELSRQFPRAPAPLFGSSGLVSICSGAFILFSRIWLLLTSACRTLPTSHFVTDLAHRQADRS
jgi:hypothetical protein